MNEQRCVVTSRHQPDRTPKATPGLMVCAGHVRKVEQMIAELPSLYDALGDMLTAGEKHGERVASSSEPGLSLNPLVAEARDEIRAELVRHVRYVADERGFSYPADDINAMATWLVNQVDWLCAQPDADETHDNLDRLSAGAHSLAYPSGRRRFTIPGVTCGAPLACDVESKSVTRCDGRLVATLMPDDDREHMSELACDSCGLELPLTAVALPQHWAVAS